MYHQFMDDLPEDLETFKCEWSKAFPLTYDTKQIAFKLWKQMERDLEDHERLIGKGFKQP